MNSIYNKNFDLFTRKYFIKGNEHLVSPYTYSQDYDMVIYELCESLLYHDSVTFHLFGENIIIPVLVNAFGLSGVRELLEQGAIKFLFNVPQVMYNVDNIEGLIPISAASGFTSDAHSVPEISAKLGMDFYAQQVSRREKRALLRKVVKNYILPDTKISANAVQFGVDGYRRNLFTEYGLPNNFDIEKLELNQRKLLCALTSEYVDIALLSQHHLYINQSYRTAKLYEDNLRYLYDSATTKKATDALFELEKLPDFTMLLKEKIIKTTDIPALRSHPDYVKFRKWIAESVEHNKSEDISKAYIEAIYSSKGLFDKEPYRFMKTVFMSIVGSFTGLLGPLSPVADVSINLLDTYLLSNVSNGWNPRHFFNRKIEPILRERNDNP